MKIHETLTAIEKTSLFEVCVLPYTSSRRPDYGEQVLDT